MPDSFEIHWAFVATSNDGIQTQRHSFSFARAPFAEGAWSFFSRLQLFGTSNKHSYYRIAFGLEWNGVETPAEFERILLRGTFGDSDVKVDLPSSFPSLHTSVVSAHSRAFMDTEFPFSAFERLEVAFSPGSNVKAGSVVRVVTEKEKARAARQAESHRAPCPFPNNVHLFSPRTRRHLWANTEDLKSSSPYFATLFASGFAEGTKSASILATEQDAGSGAATAELSDSDDERDDSLDVDERGDGDSPHPFHSISITNAAYTTYLAVLTWIQTGFIDFAPLSSSLSTASPAKREEAVLSRAMSDEDPHLPTPASPKSIYHLAPFLELPELQSLALEGISSHLSPANVAQELFGETSFLYREVQEVEMAYAAEHWEEVRESEGMKEVDRRAEVGELSAAAACVGVKLAMRLKK